MKVFLWLFMLLLIGVSIPKSYAFAVNEVNKGPNCQVSDELDIFLIVTEWSLQRQKQLYDCMRTMWSHLDATCKVHFHILVDATTTHHVLDILHQRWCQGGDHPDIDVKISLYYIQDVQTAVLPYYHGMLKYFSDKSNLYYNRTIFFVEAVLHKVLPEVVDKIMVFDIDIKFNSSVEELYVYFEHFSPSNLIGLAYEQQPTYMHYTAEYRRNNPLTRIGSPPPNGFPGFNSGVILMDLQKLRYCDTYNRLLSSVNLHHLAEKYSFRGNLGDQDYFTLLSFEHPELFYVLPCTWNRQLCRWFETHGYHEHFSAFHHCSGYIHIYHGNCNSTLPEL